LIEIRETKAKWELRKIGKAHVGPAERFVPHITLVYPFALRRGVRPFHLMEKVRLVSASFGRLAFGYVSLASKDTRRGKITVFDVKATDELQKFRHSVYQGIKDMILEEPQTREFNNPSEGQFWFHATVSMKSGMSMIDRLKEILNPIDSIESEADRICLLKSRRIVYEYDRKTNQILNRSRALRRSF
jgi:2'-5' RNA ligase